VSYFENIKISDGTATAGLDPSTSALEIIDYPHHEIHAGDSYVCTDVQSVDTTTQYWMVTTPDTTKWGHVLFILECSGEIEVTITEGADRTGTAALTAINRNRNSSNTAGITVHRGYTNGTTDGATTVFKVRSGSTNVGGRTVFGGGVRGVNEFVLKQNTKYIIKIETFATVYVTLDLNWYEHTDDN